MEDGKKSATRRWRATALLALGAIIGTMLVAQPAGAHFLPSISHIWSHIRPKADARYLQNTKTVVKAGPVVALGSFGSQTVMCPAGYQATGGGVDINQVAGGHVASSHPLINGQRALTFADGVHGRANGWYGAINNDSASPSTAPFFVVVICSK
jgi:hypothetical protein